MPKCKNCDYPYATRVKCPNCGTKNPQGGIGCFGLIIVAIILYYLSQK
jgi:hypothetical protein